MKDILFKQMSCINCARSCATAAAIILALAFFQAPCAAAPSFDNALPGVVRVGADIGPSRGNIRVPVILIGATSSPAQLKTFFSNALDGVTFRNYWMINSRGKYDARSFVIPLGDSTPAIPGASGSERQKEAAWKSLVDGILRGAVDRGELDTDYFDLSGPTRTPDGWTDGMIVLAPGVGKPMLARASGEPGKIKPEVGPYALLDSSAGPAEILAAYASLIGFVNVEGNLCMSVFDRSADGVYMVDGYNRARAGWVEVMDVTGPARSVLIIPSDSGGGVYRIGKGKEYFIVEGRDSRGQIDGAIRSPGVAVYHVDETSIGANGMTRNGSPSVTSVSPSVAASCDPADVLLNGNDSLSSDYSRQNRSVAGGIPANLNWNSGEPSDAVIRNINVSSHYPIITAEMGFE